MKDENIFLRKQLTISINELKKYSIDLNEKEQTTSDVQEENHYLTRKLEELQHTTGSHRNTVQLAQNATAAMAAISTRGDGGTVHGGSSSDARTAATRNGRGVTSHRRTP